MRICAEKLENKLRPRSFWEHVFYPGFRIRIFFFADPDPGKNLHADPDPGGIRGRGLGVKEKMIFLSFFSRFR